MKPRSHALLDRSSTAIILIDLQEPFLRNIFERERLLNRCRFLISSASILKIPVVSTTQYASKMGSLTPEVATLLGTCTHKSVDKLTFSAAANQQFTDELEKLHREQLLICGLETHICVTQTALDLAHLDYQVHCAADAVSSRTFEQHKLGMEKLRDCGILSSSAEGAVMELLYEAGSEEFKSILRLMK